MMFSPCPRRKGLARQSPLWVFKVMGCVMFVLALGTVVSGQFASHWRYGDGMSHHPHHRHFPYQRGYHQLHGWPQNEYRRSPYGSNYRSPWGGFGGQHHNPLHMHPSELQRLRAERIAMEAAERDQRERRAAQAREIELEQQRRYEQELHRRQSLWEQQQSLERQRQRQLEFEQIQRLRDDHHDGHPHRYQHDPRYYSRPIDSDSGQQPISQPTAHASEHKSGGDAPPSQPYESHTSQSPIPEVKRNDHPLHHDENILTNRMSPKDTPNIRNGHINSRIRSLKKKAERETRSPGTSAESVAPGTRILDDVGDVIYDVNLPYEEELGSGDIVELEAEFDMEDDASIFDWGVQVVVTTVG